MFISSNLFPLLYPTPAPTAIAIVFEFPTICKIFRKNDISMQQVLADLYPYAAKTAKNLQQCTKLKDNIEQLSTMHSFNSSYNSRFYLLYNTLSQLK